MYKWDLQVCAKKVSEGYDYTFRDMYVGCACSWNFCIRGIHLYLGCTYTGMQEYVGYTNTGDAHIRGIHVFVGCTYA